MPGFLRRIACAVLLVLGCTGAPTAAEARDERLLAAAGTEQAAVLATLERLVGIETRTDDVHGLAAMADFPAVERRALGAVVTRHPAATGVADAVTPAASIRHLDPALIDAIPRRLYLAVRMIADVAAGR